MQRTPALTVDCVIFRGEDVVLIRRAFEPFKGWYALPGGFVDVGESVEQACVRELLEETGLSVDKDELKLIGIYSDPSRDARRHTVSAAFLGQSNLDNLQYACIKLELMAGLDSLKKDSDIRQNIQLEMLTNKFKKSSNNLDSLDDLIVHFFNNISKKPATAEKNLWKRISVSIEKLLS